VVKRGGVLQLKRENGEEARAEPRRRRRAVPRKTTWGSQPAEINLGPGEIPDDPAPTQDPSAGINQADLVDADLEAAIGPSRAASKVSQLPRP
jgi:hypothetical protein